MRRKLQAFQIDDSAGTPLFLRIAQAIVRDIERGRLHPGDSLPGTRSLAKELGVHRNTIVAAFDELALQGWIVIQPSSGAMVSLDLPEPDLKRRRMRASAPEEMQSNAPQPFRETEREMPLIFSDGAPDPRLLPGAEFARAFRRALGSKAFLSPNGYGDARGSPRLRAALAELLSSTRGLAVGPDDIVLTRGSQMALFLAARAILSPGEAILVENPGYPLAWSAFRAAGARIIGIPVDDDGISIEALRNAAQQEQSIRAVLVTPHHQYPTTTTLGAGRRVALMRLAAEQGWVVIEDDYDHEYRYEGRPILPMAASIPSAMSGNTIYIGSLSKMLAPGLRLGYAVASADILKAMAAARESIDRQGDIPLEQAVAELLEEGDLRRHARKARRVYLERRDTLVSALRQYLGDALAFDVPAGGLALWARVRDDLDAEHWARRALERGLAISSGSRFSLHAASPPNAFRIGFAALTPDELSAAVLRLVEACPGRQNEAC